MTCFLKKSATAGFWAMCLCVLFLPTSRANPKNKAAQLVQAARKLSVARTEYDPSYISIDYPNGDPPAHIGVCSDIVVRAYRGIGVDLQQMVHEDLTANFHIYPARRFYGQKKPNPNIDHRRVTNLAFFFKRHGQQLTRSITTEPRHQWLAGDIVIFDLNGNGGTSHIGIISNRKGPSGLPLVFHHLPPYPVEDDVLSEIPISGHYRFLPSSR